MKDVYIKPLSEFLLRPNQLLQLLKSLYTLDDRGDYWGRPLRFHIFENLGMQSTISDAAFIFKRIGSELIGNCATSVDDTLHTGTKSYIDFTEKTKKRSDIKEKDWDKVKFAGIQTGIVRDGFKLYQKRYIRLISNIELTTNFTLFSSLLARLVWIHHSIPDISCAGATLRRVTDDKYKQNAKSNIKQALKVLNYVKSTNGICLMFSKLDKTSLCLCVYSDAPCAVNED